MHEVAATLETEGARLGYAMRAARGETRLHDRSLNRRLGRAARRRLVADDLSTDPKAFTGERKQIVDFALDCLLVLPRNHPAVEQEIASTGQYIVGMAAVHAGDRQARGANKGMRAMTHNFLVMLRDENEKLAGAIDRVLAKMRRAGMRRHAMHPHDRAQTSLVRGESRVRGRLADDDGIDLRITGGVELGAFAGDLL